MLRTFKGGVHPEDGKKLSAHKAIEPGPIPDVVVIPLSMHIGASAVPVVAVGDHVDLGQPIADASGVISAPVHASVSGMVTAIEPRPHPNGIKMMSIVIENDKLDTPYEKNQPLSESDRKNPDAITTRIGECGIVGLGGAAFPTAPKIRSGFGKIDRLIINGAECEPYITSGYRLMLERTEELISGIRLLMTVFGLNTAYIGIESNKLDAVAHIESMLTQNDGIIVYPLKTKYPQGAEKQLIRAVTGRKVPPASLPAAVGCAVFNVDTVIAVHHAVYDGQPLTTKVVTFSGDCVANPKNLEVRIGTPIADILKDIGGFKEPPRKVLFGGPMMGIAQPNLNAQIIKSTNAILGLSGTEDPLETEHVCVHCGRCLSVCPMNLMPVYMYAHAERGQLDKCEQLNILDCMECGSCSYICMGRLHLVQMFKKAKGQITEANRQAK